MANFKDLVLRIVGDATSAKKAFEDVKRQAEETREKLKDTGDTGANAFDKIRAVAGTAGNALGAVSLVVGGVVGSLTAISVAAGKLGQSGNEILKLRTSFEDLALSAGLVPQVLLGDLQEATQGGIANTELYRIANKALALDLESVGVNIAELAGKVKTFSDISGGDATQAINTFVQALATGKTQSLANLDIVVDTEQALESYAKSLGTTTDRLTQQQEATAKAKAVMEALSEATSKLSEGSDTVADAYERVTANLQNARDSFAEAFTQSDSLRQAFDDLAVTIANTDWERLAEQVAELAAIVVKLSGYLVKLGENWDYVFNKAEAGASITRKWANEQINSAKSVDQLEASLGSAITEIDRLEKQIKAWDKENQSLIFGSAELNDKMEAAKALADGYRGQVFRLQQAIDTFGQAQTNAAKKTSDAGTSLRNQSKDSEEARKKAEQLQKEIEKLTESFADLQTKTQNEIRLDGFSAGLEKATEDALKSLDEASFTPALEAYAQEFERQTIEALTKAYDKALKAGTITEAQIKAQAEVLTGRETRAKQKEFAENLGDAIDQRFEKSADFFTDALYNAFTGKSFDLEDALKRVFAGAIGGALAQATGGFGAEFGNLQGLGQSIGAGLIKSIGGNIFGGGAAGGASTGSVPAGAIGTAANGGFIMADGSIMAPATVGASIGTAFLSAIAGAGAAAGALGVFQGGLDLAQGGKFGAVNSANLAFVTGGASFLIDPVSGLFGGGGDKDEQARRAFRDQLNEKGNFGENLTINTSFGKSDSIYDIDFAAVADGVKSANSQLNAGIGLTAGLADAITGGGKLGEDFNAIFAQLVTGFRDGTTEAGSFQETFLNTLNLLDATGQTTEGAKDNLKQLFAESKISLDEFTSGVQSLNSLASGVAVEGVGGITEAFRTALDALNDGNITTFADALALGMREAAEEGITSMSGLADYVASNFSPEVGAAIRQIAALGITEFQSFSNISSDHLIAIISALTPVKDAVEGVGVSLVDTGNVGTQAFAKVSTEFQQLVKTATGGATEIKNDTSSAFNAAGTTGTNRFGQVTGAVDRTSDAVSLLTELIGLNARATDASGSVITRNFESGADAARKYTRELDSAIKKQKELGNAAGSVNDKRGNSAGNRE